jgi:hypothetical protein
VVRKSRVAKTGTVGGKAKNKDYAVETGYAPERDTGKLTRETCAFKAE